ncbi:MAG: membrane protein insertase YidC [Clostridia bacterium]|nr:membrane protein insertase YidC [Clostridia bacterium]
MNKKTRKGRFLTLAVLMLTVLLVLSGCARQTAKAKLELPETISSVEGGNLTSDQLKAIATLMVSVYDDASFDVRDMLIAANRGHNMLADGFDDKNVNPNETGTADPVETGKAVIARANEKAADDKKIGDDVYASMNGADLNRLVEIFQTEVDVTSKGGLWDKILCGIGACLGWITRYLGFGSYIVGICLFAVIVEILLLPFAIKQQKNSIRQAQLRPKEMAIRNKYKGRNDQPTQQKVAQEIQELYQRENFSPYSGCLQLLLQFPILIALYNIVIDPLHYVLGQGAGVSAAMQSYYTAARAAGGLGQTLSASSNSTIALLSGNSISEFSGIANFAYFKNGGAVWESIESLSVPNFNILGINFGVIPNFENNLILLLVPVLTFVVYFFSMKLSRKFTYQATQQEGVNDRQVACSNTMMDVSMPLMSTFFAFIVPAIIGVYWIFRSILGTIKQFIMSRVMPLPVFTEEDYKAAAREMAGKAPKKVEKSARAGTVRSLHHIDDEDYEDTRERALKREEAMAAKEKAEQAERAKKTPFGMASLKKDRTEEAAEQEKQPEETDEKQD